MHVAVPAATRHALRCLRHPVTVVAVVTLVVNDHLLKGSAAPGWLTGKLSDFAGLFFFPFLAAVLVGTLVRSRHWAGVVSFAITGAWFAAAKALPAAHSATVALIEAVVGARPVVRLDPTDLLALVALVPAWRLWHTVDTARAPHWRSVVAVAVAGLAALATTPYDPGVLLLTVEDETVTAWVADENDEGPGDSYVSDDGGVTWRYGNQELPDLGDDWRDARQRVGCAPTLPDECYRARRGRHTDRLERSVDGGQTWVPTFRAPYLLRGGVKMRVTDLAVVPQSGSYAAIVAVGVDGVVVRADGGDWQPVAVGPTGRLRPPTPLSDTITAPAAWAALLGAGVWGSTLYMGRPTGRRGRRRRLPSPATGRWTARLAAQLAVAVLAAFVVREALVRFGGEGALIEPSLVLLAGIPIGLAALVVAAVTANRFQAEVLEVRTPPAWWWWAPALAVWVVATYQIVDRLADLA